MPPIQILELGNESSEASHSITTHLEDKKKKNSIFKTSAKPLYIPTRHSKLYRHV